MATRTKTAPGNHSTLMEQWVERRCDSVYDRVRLKAGNWTPEEIVCFSVPVGQVDLFTGQRRTYVDTNMVKANEFSAPHDMIAHRFLFLFQPSCSQSDRDAWLANYQWDFTILEKVFAREPMIVAGITGRPEDVIENFGKGSWQVTEDRENHSSSLIGKLGVGVAWDLAEFEDARKYIPPLCYFAVTLRGKSFRLESDIDFYVMLHGMRDYPVQ